MEVSGDGEIGVRRAPWGDGDREGRSGGRRGDAATETVDMDDNDVGKITL